MRVSQNADDDPTNSTALEKYLSEVTFEGNMGVVSSKRTDGFRFMNWQGGDRAIEVGGLTNGKSSVRDAFLHTRADAATRRDRIILGQTHLW